ncbi:MAG: lysine exporter LysO family protein, partial [Eubacteriales bacterium]|nr:lysine exporter LysO family protein [Eubacteriales bacterium]
MSDLILYVFLAIIGYFIASKLREHKEKIKFIGTVQMIAIICLVVIMGLRMGSNEEVVSNLNLIGLYALIFTLLTMAGSVLAVILMRKIMKIDKQGRLLDISENSEELENNDQQSGGNGKIMTVVITVAVSIGLLSGYFFVDKIFPSVDSFNSFANWGIRLGLCLILFLVGFDMGLDGTVVRDYKTVGIKVIIVPFVIGLGTLVAAAFCGLIMPVTMREALAIGGGFGWYSFAPVLILERGLITASAISFMHNILRELLSLLFIPLVAKKIGYLESIALCACC